ncbi:MAG: hypothetical protein DRH50_15150 [Deltaproteobacteria bacterium]|nr:MAG: hypothetical protein DRH50_15150 [Deltaproteobacteria bacterium]
MFVKFNESESEMMLRLLIACFSLTSGQFSVNLKKIRVLPLRSKSEKDLQFFYHFHQGISIDRRSIHCYKKAAR